MSNHNSKKVTHVDFGRLVLRLQSERELVEKKFTQQTITEIAEHYKVPGSTLRLACESIGVQVPKRGAVIAYGGVRDPAVTALLKVVATICPETSVNREILRPFLTE